jgi:aspartyl/glutamyl-tRNA(Asn/Gln) amidotransferase C subunit
LNELDTKDVAPTTQVGEAGTPMRDDEVTNRPDAEAMLANAPLRDRNYFKVPKIIE